MVELLNRIKTPLALLLLVITLELLTSCNILPDSQVLSDIIKDLINKHGLIIIGLLGFLENLAAFNVYFPGSIVILTTMTLSAGNPMRAALIFLLYYASAILAYHVDFWMGATFGRKMIKILKKISSSIPSIDKNYPNLWKRFLIFFSHPQLASILCVQIGDEDYKYSQIIKYILIFCFIWTLFWSLAMYFIGTLTGSSLDLKIIVYIYLFGLIFYEIYKYIKELVDSK